MIYYINGKGNKVTVEIKRHAVLAYRDRYNKLFEDNITAKDAEAKLIMSFPHATRISRHNDNEKKRIKRHGHTLYFRDGNFTYVVHNAVMMTVEISRKGYRGLN